MSVDNKGSDPKTWQPELDAVIVAPENHKAAATGVALHREPGHQGISWDPN